MTEMYAIVEQMGHVRFGARVVQDTSWGITMLKCVVLTEPPSERIIHPQSLYALTPCTEEQARTANRGHSAPRLALPAPEDTADDDPAPGDTVEVDALEQMILDFASNVETRMRQMKPHEDRSQVFAAVLRAFWEDFESGLAKMPTFLDRWAPLTAGLFALCRPDVLDDKGIPS